MAIFQPTNIVPSTLSGLGEGTIAPTDLAVISWQVNGDSPMTSYKIDIMENTSEATSVFSTGIINIFDSPFYPTDQYGVPQRFVYSNSQTWEDLGITGGKEYKLIITQYWDFLTTPTFVVQYSPSVFRAREKPTLAIDSFPNPLNAVSNVFTAQYSQAQSDAINWVRWTLSNSDGVVITDTGEIPTSVLRFEYDGFMNNTMYVLSLTVETENGVQARVIQNFTVEYSSPQLQGTIDISCGDDGSVIVEWPQVQLLIGEPSPREDYGTYLTGGLRLNVGSSVYWEFGAEKYSLYLHYTFDSNPSLTSFQYDLIELGEYTLELTVDRAVQITKVSAISNEDNTSLGDVFISHTSAGFELYVAINSDGKMFASLKDNYSPTGDTYSAEGVANIKGYAFSDVYLSRDSSQVVAEYDYIYVSDNVDSNLQEFFISAPTWNANTMFFADFDNNLKASLYGGSSNPKAAIYRQDENALVPLGVVYYGVFTLKDYGVKSNTSPSYLVFYVSDNAYSEVLQSDPRCFRYGAYSLIEATQNQDTPNIYNVQNVWLFGANVEAGTVSNNNAPNMLENFTKYPYRQPSSQAARSGVLQALIKNVKNGVYSDSAADMDALFSISQSTNIFFLKDMKGNLYMVHTSGPITQTINNRSVAQEVTVSIPWQEIGDAEGLAIIGEI